MAKAGQRKIAKYGDRFKATAVKLSSLPGVQIKDVAATLDIHPFMLRAATAYNGRSRGLWRSMGGAKIFAC